MTADAIFDDIRNADSARWRAMHGGSFAPPQQVGRLRTYLNGSPDMLKHHLASERKIIDGPARKHLSEAEKKNDG